MGDEHGHAGGAVRRQRAARVEPEPAYPEHAGAGHGHGQVVRRHCNMRKPIPITQHQGRYQGRNACRHVDHRAAGEVAKTDLGEPAATPHPMRHREVNQHDPGSDEYQQGGKPHALGNATHEQRRCDDREGQLEHDEYGFGIRAAQRIHADPAEPGLGQAADVAADAVAERKAVAADHPNERNQTSDGEALHDDREHVAISDQPRIKERQTGQCHEQHQRGGCQHPCSVAGVKCLTPTGHGPRGHRQDNSGC